jgi:hypothetical protein
VRVLPCETNAHGSVAMAMAMAVPKGETPMQMVAFFKRLQPCFEQGGEETCVHGEIKSKVTSYIRHANIQGTNNPWERPLKKNHMGIISFIMEIKFYLFI